MKFLKLTKDKGSPVWIPVDKINSIQGKPYPEFVYNSIVSFGTAGWFEADQTPEEIFEKLLDAKK